MSMHWGNRDLLTCYGEYNLEDWVKMILNGNLILPEFQRGLAWSMEKGAQLILILLDRSFVPPIVIGGTTDKTGRQINYVLDGQQRLSSLLLFYLGYWPRDYGKGDSQVEIAEEDYILPDGESEKIGMKWTFVELQAEYNKVGTLDRLREKLAQHNNYVSITKILAETKHQGLKEKFSAHGDITKKFSVTYLGFAFLKGMSGNRELEMATYSQVFRSINSLGTPLTPMESREALNWLNPQVKELLSPPFAQKFKINAQRLDWVRDLALCSQAAQLLRKQRKGFSVQTLAKGYSGKLEQFIERYVRTVSAQIPDSEFLPFNQVYVNQLQSFQVTMSSVLSPFKDGDDYIFKNYLTADIYLFGIIYWVIFKSQIIDIKHVDSIISALNKVTDSFRKQLTHDKNNQLGFLRLRMEKSLLVYSKFLEKS